MESVKSPTQAHDCSRIRQILEDAYIRDMYVQRGSGPFAREFAECFQMLVPEIDGRTGMTIAADWVGREEMTKNHPKAIHPNTRFEFPWIEIEGNAAVARIEILENEAPKYTDFVCLHRIDGSWRIVSKLFHNHSRASVPR